MINSAQCRAARALIGWTMPQLAAAAGVSVGTINNFELGRRAPIAANMTVIRTALESAGVVFIAENGGGPGVRLRKDATAVAEHSLGNGEVE